MASKLGGYQHNNIMFILLHIMLQSSMLEAAITGLRPEGIQCACAGDMLTYNCTIMGGITTLWRGTALDCPLDGSEITLRHSQFASNQEIGICSNGDIQGRSIGVFNNCYTSQLNVTVRESFNNKTVQCAFTSSVETRTIGESLLSVASATNLYPPPDNLYLADVQPGILVFNWTPVTSNCSMAYVQYSITSDCGACSTVTNMTTAICSHLQLTTNAVLCHFRVSSRACGLVGTSSSPTAVTLKGIPQVEIVPGYSADRQALEKLFIVKTVNQTEDHFYISGNISGSPTSYTAHGSNLICGTSFNSTVRLAFCEEAGGCPMELPSSDKSYCPQSTIINVTISAANKLGVGPPSNPFIIECTNNFVQVVYRETSSISCVFLNQSDTSEKICCVTFGPCDQREPGNTQTCNSSSNSSYNNNINIQLEVADPSSNCYTITASNDTYIVKVEGTFVLGGNRRGNSNVAAITAGVVVPIIFILLLLGAGMLSLVVWVAKMKLGKNIVKQADSECVETTPLSDITFFSQNPLKPYLMPYSVPTTSKLHEVDGDCNLRDFVIEISVSNSFRRGHTYYLFTNEVENILEGKEVLLQEKRNTEKWFRLAPPEKVAAGGLKLYGEGIALSGFGDGYKVFIQSFGSGDRHLPRDSEILYNNIDQEVEPDALLLVPICSEHFAHKAIDSERGCTEFCKQNGLNTTAFNLFLTVEHLPEDMRDQPPRDVILMDKRSKELFTGPKARQMLDPRNGGESQHENEKWKVFVLLKQKKQGFVLKKGSEILYQDPRYLTGKYTVVEVDEDNDNVRMSKFIKKKLHCQFEDGKAFYEASENEEDFLYYKKILRPEEEKLSLKQLELQSLVEYFYAIDGVPTKGVKPEQLQLDKHKIFIQSTSQGSRCLKKGEKLLYLKEYDHKLQDEANHARPAGSGYNIIHEQK